MPPYEEQAYFVFCTRYYWLSTAAASEINTANLAGAQRDFGSDPYASKEWKRMEPWQREMAFGARFADVEELPQALKARFKKQLREAARFEQDLNSLEPAELREIYEEAFAEMHPEADKLDRIVGFKNSIDWEHWKRAAAISAHEAMALSFGADPEVLDESRLEQALEHGSEQAEACRRRLDLLNRAVVAGDLSEMMRPSEALSWMEKNEIEPIDDNWISAVRRIKTASASEDEDRPALAKSADYYRQQLKTERVRCSTNRNTMLRLIGAVVFGHYGYDPEANRGSTVTEVHTDSITQGLQVGKDAIRQYLAEAAGLRKVIDSP